MNWLDRSTSALSTVSPNTTAYQLMSQSVERFTESMNLRKTYKTLKVPGSMSLIYTANKHRQEGIKIFNKALLLIETN